MKRWHRIGAGAFAFVVATLFAMHYAIRAVSRIEPPPTPQVGGRLQIEGSVRRFGPSYARRVGRLWEARLEGTPAQIGTAHARLLRQERIATERVVWDLFSRFVPSAVARALVLDLARWEYRNVADGFAPARLVELAAEAQAFSPDPFVDPFPAFQRFVYLNALYDISLGFEHSPLIGCTTFILGNDAGPVLLARAFDFEVDPIFDEMKTVFLVREPGRIPFASVAWPGLVGVLSGMNAEGLGAVVHGARAGETVGSGEPVVHAIRRVLGTTRTIDDAVAAFAERSPMVSHVVILVEASGKAAAVERIPGREPFVRRLDSRAVVTNHLIGPARNDPKNQRVRNDTSTLAREARGREIVTAAPDASVEAAVGLLRDRKGPGGKDLPLGDRRAIDALIATHGVVMDPKQRILWVSEPPHLLGRFVAFDLRELLDDGFEPTGETLERPVVVEDPLVRSAVYRKIRAKELDVE